MQDVMIFLFQSTRPVRGATVLDDVAAQESHVSIHAPHAGRDLVKALRRFRCRCFNPRAPCGARPCVCINLRMIQQFQSTRPVWGATGVGRGRRYSCRVSIHAPRVGRDLRRPHLLLCL